MVTNSFDNFYKELNHVIQRQTATLYPLIGVIHKVSESREYVDVKIEGGIITNIPAHGFPVRGDSCIIHFINGNVEQPVCDCARRLSPPQDQYVDMLTSDCNNYLTNGDFNQKGEGYTGTFEIIEDEGFTDTSNYACHLKKDQYVEFTCDISNCETKYFKFQANYKGNGILRIECFDNDTGETILPAPENIAEPVILWVSENGRFGWSFNKEAYLRGDTTTVKFKLTNYTEKAVETIPKQQIGEELVEVPLAVTIDGLVVYDENADNNFYWSKEDVVNLLSQEQ